MNLADYYPPTSRRIGEEGPVAVQFRLKKAEGSPSDVHVVGSSLSPRLDEAAVKAFGDMVLKTTCVGREYRMQMMFKLN